MWSDWVVPGVCGLLLVGLVIYIAFVLQRLRSALKGAAGAQFLFNPPQGPIQAGLERRGDEDWASNRRSE